MMNACLRRYATPALEDESREEWFAKRQERAKAKLEKEKRKAEQQKFLREWWGLEESERDERLRRDAEAKMTRGERIGGFASRDRRRFEGGAAEQGKER